MKILLHICCGPCAIYPVETLRAQGFEVLGYFDNPNIHPYQEYLRRVEALRVFAAQAGLPVLWRPEYDPEEFFRLVAYREQERCRFCYYLRLSRTAARARREGISRFSTTLLYSRYQPRELIGEIARQAAAEAGVEFLFEDFRPGWAEGVAKSKALGLYRQPYCGCLFSERDRYLRPPRQSRSGGE